MNSKMDHTPMESQSINLPTPLHQNNPSNPQLLYRMGALCYLCGHQPAAIFVLEKALEIAPEEHFLLFTFAPELKKATSILECILRFTTIRYE